MKNARDYLQLIFFLFCAFALSFFSESAKSGAQTGLKMFLDIILPSLLPMLIIFKTAIKTRASVAVGKLLSPIAQKALRLPEASASALLFGALGGYPCTAVLTEELFEKGELSREEAQRILMFNINGGVAFIVSAVGSFTLRSTAFGFILWLSIALSSFVLGIFLSIGKEKITSKSIILFESKPLSDALCEAVEEAVRSVMLICAYVVFFCAFFKILQELFAFSNSLFAFFEVTASLCSKNSFSLPETAFFLAFSGFCVHLQIMGISKKIKPNYARFLLFRVIHGVLSALFCYGISCVFHIEREVFSNAQNPVFEPSVNGAALSFLLVIGCFVFLFDVERRRKAA